VIKALNYFLRSRSLGLYAKNTITLLAGSSAAHLIAALMLPILSRLYSPEQFGEFGIFLSIIGITAVFSSGKFELAIISEPKLNRRVALALLAIITSLIFISLLLLLYAVSVSINVFELEGVSWSLVVLICGGLVATVTHDALMNFKISQETVLPIARAKVVRVKFGLPFGEVAGRVSAVVSVCSFKYRKFTKVRIGRMVTHLKLVAKRNLEYPFKIAPSWTLNNSSTLLLPAFLAWQYDLAVSGGFFLMYKIFSLPETAVVQSVNQSFMVEFKRHLGSPKKQLEVFKKTAKTLFSLSLIIYPILGLLFYLGVGVIFGAEWQRYSLFGVLMIPYFIAQFTMSSLYVSLNILSEHSSQVVWDLFRSGMLCLLCVIVSYLDIHALYFISFLSVLTLVSYALLFLLIRSVIYKKCG
jgi:O-antigen/teichoic acid export membrane protein